jgi:hypothetical protein
MHLFDRQFLGSISLGSRDDNQRGARFRARFESRHNLVCGRSKDPNHDAVMRIGSEAPKRRTHSSNRHESQGTCRESTTSNRHRYSIVRAETVGVLLSVLQSLCRTQNDAALFR